MTSELNTPTLDELEAAASEKFAWKWDAISIANQPYKLAVAADPDSMLIEACERQDAGEEGVIDPFWATTWRAAAGLDRFLDQVDVKDVPVLELGCGTGHAGIAAMLRGGKVTLTDGVEDPLLLVRMSVWQLRDQCTVERLRFGIDTIDDQSFPIILGSDVTYLRQLWPELDVCMRQHLAKGGQVLLSDPYRFIANEFREWIQKRGWHYTEHKVELADDPKHPIRVMQLRDAK
ncbi:SAM-dependent methyltransferase [Novipirellula rosea]|uniref:Methyltransferase domain-containing protein n=1 Tax=Novipirellula rosea TaxID=1031540 RepID=A0ABP8MJY2_9BACT|tara:strand:+ start:1647 stop:2345 length:699 start_codon:yes stop_codon:yes gene_type:complete